MPDIVAIAELLNKGTNVNVTDNVSAATHMRAPAMHVGSGLGLTGTVTLRSLHH